MVSIHGGDGAQRSIGRMMAPRTDTIRDWTYREAKLRLRTVARSLLPRHAAHVRLNRAGNRVVACDCGWHGDGPGWLSHVDEVVSSALHD